MIEQLPDLHAMQAFGSRIADKMLPGDVVALEGALGAGKTTLARAILYACHYTDDVPSPTFTIVQPYDPPATCIPIVHADFYRLDDPRETLELGLDEYRQGAVLLAEWPERAGGFAHEAGCLSIRLETEEQGRKAIVEGGEDWQSRMP